MQLAIARSISISWPKKLWLTFIDYLINITQLLVTSFLFHKSEGGYGNGSWIGEQYLSFTISALTPRSSCDCTIKALADYKLETLYSNHIILESLLGVIREQGECPFRHRGAGSKDQNSQGSREHENSNQGAWSTGSVSKKTAESKAGTNINV